MHTTTDTAPMTCYFCGAVRTPDDPPMTWCNAPHWSGSADYDVAMTEGSARFLRVDVCGHEGCRGQVRDFPKRPRQPRRPRRTAQPLYGDYAQLAAFNGIRTDGTGRRAR